MMPSREAIEVALDRSPLQGLMRRRTSTGLTVLAYHGVEDRDRFIEQMDLLEELMNPVGVPEVVSAIAGGSKLPPHPVLVTFDDGERSVLDTAAPVLARRGIPAVVFVVAGVIGGDDPFWWRAVEHDVMRIRARGETLPDPEEVVRKLKRASNQERLRQIGALRRRAGEPPLRTRQLQPSDLKELEGMGCTIGNHTFTHPCLDRCTPREAEDEIRRAHGRLSDLLDRRPALFAYPNGNFDSRVVPVLDELGYEAAFLFDHRTASCPPPDRFRVSRVRVSSAVSRTRFRLLLSGLHPALHHLLGRS